MDDRDADGWMEAALAEAARRARARRRAGRRGRRRPADRQHRRPRATTSASATGDPTAHAELLALRDARAAAGTWRLDELRARRRRSSRARCARARRGPRASALLVFGAADPKAGRRGQPLQLRRRPAPQPRAPRSCRACAADECGGAAHGVLREPSASRPRPCRLTSRPEGCESGRIGWSRKPLWRKSPWVQIPLPPLWSTIVRRS